MPLANLDALDDAFYARPKIGVIGAGRLGICFALLVARGGYDVIVSDVRESYVKSLKEKKISTNEPLVEE